MKEKSEQSPILPNAHGSLVVISPESRLGRAIGGSARKAILPVAAALSLIASACSGGEAQTVTDNSDNEPPGLALPFEGTGFLNSGPHNFKLKRDAPTEKEVVSELDFAPKPVIKCEPGVRAIVTDWNITASESGKVTIVGDEKNELDFNHSIIQIKHPDGKSTRYTHVANIQVKKDQEVPKGQRLGNASCEYPPSGSTDGLHLDFSVLDPSENPIDVRTITLSGWTIEGKLNYQGTMTKDGKTITADGRRCPEENPCEGGIVNSITHDSSKTPNKAVLGAEKSPNSQISGNVNEKRVKEAIPTPRPTERPTPAPTSAPILKKETPIPTVIPTPALKKDLPTPTPTEKPAEQGWIKFTSPNYPYRIDIPFFWQPSSTNVGGKKTDVFLTKNTVAGFEINVSVAAEPVGDWVILQDYAKTQLGQLRQVTSIQSFQFGPDRSPFEEETSAGNVGINIARVRVGGKDTAALLSRVPKGFVNPPLEIETVIFLHEGKAWQITLTYPQYPSNPGTLTEKQYIALQKEFRKLLESFRFLPSR